MSNTVTDLLGEVGNGLHMIVNSDATLYGVYLFAFFFGIYSLFSFILGKLKLFKDSGKKPAKVVAFMFSVISTGAIFYGTGPSARSTHDLLMLFHGFGGFLIILIFTLGFAAGGVFLFNKYKDKNFKLAMLFLTLFFYIASSLMIPQLGFMLCGEALVNSNGNVIAMSNLERCATFASSPSFIVFGDILNWIKDISFVLMIIYLVMVVIDLFSEKEGSSKPIKRNSDEQDKNEKEIAKARSLVKNVMDELNSVNDTFNDKVKNLNALRGSIGNIEPGIDKLQENYKRELEKRNSANNNQGGRE